MNTRKKTLVILNFLQGNYKAVYFNFLFQQCIFSNIQTLKFYNKYKRITYMNNRKKNRLELAMHVLRRTITLKLQNWVLSYGSVIIQP